MLVLSMLVTGGVFASQINIDELSSPSLELVTTIHEYCLEQYSTEYDTHNNSATLQCVNNDLEISTYKTFKTYAELSSFVSQEKGE